MIGSNRSRERGAALKIVEDAGRGQNGIFSIKIMSSYADQVDEILSPSGLKTLACAA